MRLQSLATAVLATHVYASQVPLAARPAGLLSGRAVTPELSAYAEQLLDDHGIPGMSAGVVYVNKTTGSVETEFGTWGTRTEEGDVVQKETLFYIGSCSKAFLAAAAGILMDDFATGKNVTALPDGIEFTWTTKIKDLFPGDSEWKLEDDVANEKVNVADIFSHVTGLPAHDLAYSVMDSPYDVVRRMRYLKPTSELRERFQYNNQMFVLGSHIVEKYAKMPFPQFVKERIFVPLDMSSSVYFTSEIPAHAHISEAFIDGKRRIPHWFDEGNVATLIAGAGGIISNTVDMTKWIAMLLNEGVNPHTGDTVIPKSAFDTITTARVIMSGKAQSPDRSILGYALGWGRYSYRGHEIVQHTGGLPGFLTFVGFLPWDGVGVVAFVNNGDAYDAPGLLGTRLFDNALGLEHRESIFTETTSYEPTEQPPPGSALPAVTSVPFTPASQPPLPLPLESYTGTYSNQGYGAFTLCSPTSTSNYCSQVLATFSSVQPPDALPGLYASWSRLWTKHVRLTHRSDHKFRFETVTIFPRGYGRNTTAFIENLFGNASLTAVFDIEDGVVRGLALPNEIAYSGASTLDEALSLENALVYFKRV